MASQTGLRQASRSIQSSRLHVHPLRTRKYSSRSLFVPSSSSLSSNLSSRSQSRLPSLPSYYGIQQTRQLSLWGSSQATPSPQSTPSANVTIKEPIDFENSRAVKANDTTSDLSSTTSHPPNLLEPQFLEDAQQNLLGPHGAEATSPLAPEDVPERVGYLAEVCGLDFGWGPSTTMQWILEHLHISAGLSWTASIVAMGFLLRATMIPLMVGAAQQAAKLREMGSVLNPRMADYKQAVAAGDQAKAAQLMMQIRSIRAEAGLDFKKMFYPVLIQLPFGFGAWRVLRNSASLPVPGFVTESWLWATDLTFSDPYYITPALSTAMIYFTIKANAKLNATAAGGAGVMNSANMSEILAKVMPPLSFVFMIFQPGAVQLYFLSSSFVGLLTTYLMRWSWIRNRYDLPPIPGTAAASTTNPSQSADSASTIKPGGLNRRTNTIIEARARVLDDHQAAEAQAQQNISAIDKGVNAVKNIGSSLRKNIDSVSESAMGKKEEREMARRKERNEEYDARVRHRLDEQRQERNAAASNKR